MAYVGGHREQNKYVCYLQVEILYNLQLHVYLLFSLHILLLSSEEFVAPIRLLKWHRVYKYRYLYIPLFKSKAGSCGLLTTYF